MLVLALVRRSFYVIAFVGYIFFVTKFFHHLYDSPLVPDIVAAPVIVYPPTQEKTVVTAGVPVRLSIPSINVTTTIDTVGVTVEGAMDIKKDPTTVAWYNLGARPGDVGNAVIAGHYGWDNGRGSVFNELHTLKQGDEITVGDDKGATTSFIVRESRSYDPAADAKTVFRSGDGKAHLNLVTCEGAWNNSKQTYSERLVVFADKKV